MMMSLSDRPRPRNVLRTILAERNRRKFEAALGGEDMDAWDEVSMSERESDSYSQAESPSSPVISPRVWQF